MESKSHSLLDGLAEQLKLQQPVRVEVDERPLPAGLRIRKISPILTPLQGVSKRRPKMVFNMCHMCNMLNGEFESQQLDDAVGYVKFRT